MVAGSRVKIACGVVEVLEGFDFLTSEGGGANEDKTCETYVEEMEDAWVV